MPHPRGDASSDMPTESARVGDQSDGVRKQAIDHFGNDEAEIEDSANGERHPEIRWRTHVAMTSAVCAIVAVVIVMFMPSHRSLCLLYRHDVKVSPLAVAAGARPLRAIPAGGLYP